MGNSRIQKLTSNGETRYYEAIASGSSYVAVKAASALSGTITVTLPSTLPVSGDGVLIISSAGAVSALADGSAGESLTTDGAGGYSWENAAGSLQGAYDGGNTIAVDAALPVAISQANDDAAVTISKAGTGAGTVLAVSNGGTGTAVTVTATADGRAILVSANVAASQSYVHFAIGASSNQAGLSITNAGSGRSIHVSQQNSNIAVYAETTTGTHLGTFYGTNAGSGPTAYFEKTSVGVDEYVVNAQNASNGGGIIVNPNILIGLAAANQYTTDASAITGTKPGLALQRDQSANFGLVNVSAGASANAAVFAGLKTRSAGTNDANTVVNSGDGVLALVGYAADGAAYQPVAQVRFEVDGTPGSGDMPGRITFSTTADGSGSLVEHLKIANTGIISSTQATANGILALTKSDVSGGVVIAITNAGTGRDIQGNSANWYVTPEGDATFNSVTTTTGNTLSGVTYASTMETINTATMPITDAFTWYKVEGEGAASDTLSTITGGTDGRYIILTAYDDAHTITVDDAGNIELNGSSHALDSLSDVLTLMYVAASSKWIELNFSSNA
jgi:hypothetical protein